LCAIYFECKSLVKVDLGINDIISQFSITLIIRNPHIILRALYLKVSNKLRLNRQKIRNMRDIRI